jgi:hypothetical protein
MPERLAAGQGGSANRRPAECRSFGARTDVRFIEILLLIRLFVDQWIIYQLRMSTVRNLLTKHHAEIEARIVELQAELAEVRVALQALAATDRGAPANAANVPRSVAEVAPASRRSPGESAAADVRSPGESAVRAYRNSATADAGG